MQGRTRFHLVALLALSLPLAAHAQGILVPTEPGLRPLQIGHQRVRVQIVDGTAVTKVDQTFVNHSGRQLEATYLFPLPKGAALQDFALWMKGKKTKGEVLETQKARRVYEGIVRRMRDPGLLEYVDHDLFRARVFPVPPRGEMRIEISFSQVLRFNDGVYTYTYPLGAAKVSGIARTSTAKDFTFTASITSKVPIKSVYSPTHEVDVRRPSDHSAKLGFEKVRERLDRDLTLYYTVGRGDLGMNLLTYAEEGEPGTFLLMVSPKQAWQKKEILGKVVTFVVDTSGSMARKKLQSAKKALIYCLERLLPEDRFNIVRFSTDVETFRDAPVAATEANRKAARAFVQDFYSSGGTAIHEALLTALRDAPQNGAPHLVVFLTDGEPTVGVTDENALASDIAKHNTKQSRIFAFGVGEDLNAPLLDRIAAESGASVEYARDGKETEVKLSGFYNRIAFPILSDVSVDLGGARAFDVYPKTLPALFKGTQVIIVGRYRQSGTHDVVLRGRTGKSERRYRQSLRFPKVQPEHAFIARLWAVRKVGYLLEEIRSHGETTELKQEVIRLGKKFGIVTPYTSYLVAEDEPPPIHRRQVIDDFARDRTFLGRSGERREVRAAAPEAPARPAKLKALAGGGGFEARVGGAAVAASEAVKELKEAGVAEEEAGTRVRTAAGRTFVWQDGAWTDSKWKRTLKVLKVAYLSEAYFEILHQRPKLKAALALGEHVRIVVGPGRGIEIGPKGEKGAKSVRAFLN